MTEPSHRHEGSCGPGPALGHGLSLWSHGLLEPLWPCIGSVDAKSVVTGFVD